MYYGKSVFWIYCNHTLMHLSFWKLYNTNDKRPQLFCMENMVVGVVCRHHQWHRSILVVTIIDVVLTESLKPLTSCSCIIWFQSKILSLQITNTRKRMYVVYVYVWNYLTHTNTHPPTTPPTHTHTYIMIGYMKHSHVVYILGCFS